MHPAARLQRFSRQPGTADGLTKIQQLHSAARLLRFGVQHAKRANEAINKTIAAAARTLTQRN